MRLLQYLFPDNFFLFLSNQYLFGLNKGLVYLAFCFRIFLSCGYYRVVDPFVVVWGGGVVLVCNGEYLIPPQNGKHLLFLFFELLLNGWPHLTPFLLALLLAVILAQEDIGRFSLLSYLHHELFDERWPLVDIIELPLWRAFLPLFL